MYVVRTSKNLSEETPNVNIQFHPNEVKNDKGEEQRYIAARATEVPSQAIVQELNSAETGLQDKGTVSLLKNLDLPYHKMVQTATNRSTQQLPQNRGLTNKNLTTSELYTVPTAPDQSQNVQKTIASEVYVSAALQNSLENVLTCTTSQDCTDENGDVYHIIELSGNEEADFDPSSYESIVYVQQVPLENVESNTNEQFPGNGNSLSQSSVGVQADGNVALKKDPGTSKYDSSKAKVSSLQKYTPEDLASMGKTVSDLIYNYPGRKFPFRPKQSTEPALEEHSPKLSEQEECKIPVTNAEGKITEKHIKLEKGADSSKSFECLKVLKEQAKGENSTESLGVAEASLKLADKIDSSKSAEQDEFGHDNGDCSGCEDTESSTIEKEDSGESVFKTSSSSTDLERNVEMPGIDKWSHDLGLRRIDVNKIQGPESDNSNLIAHRESRRLKNNKGKKLNYKSVIENGGKYHRKQTDNGGSDIEKSDSHVEHKYWKDVCKCYHYANKSVIKISPILQSMVKDGVCIVEFEVEDSLKVGSIKKVAGAHGKEMYCLTIEKQKEEEKHPETKPKSKRKGSQAKNLHSTKLKPNSKSRKRKRSKNMKADGTEDDFEVSEPEDIPKKSSKSSESVSKQSHSNNSKVETYKDYEMNDDSDIEELENFDALGDINEKSEKDQQDDISNEENNDYKPQRKSKRLSNASYTRKSYSYLNDEIKEEVTPKDTSDNDGESLEAKEETESKTERAEIKEPFRKRNEQRGKKKGKMKKVNEPKKTEKKARENEGEKRIVPKRIRRDRIRKIKHYTLIKNENGEKMYGCNFCDYQTDKLHTMHGHTFDHTGERPFVCEVCGKSFRRSSNLNSHRFQHAETSVFTCQLCNRGFNDRSSYKTHVRRHIGLKNHTCEECGKGFITSTDKKKHMRGHTGEKPYQCDHCAKRFRDGSSLHRHIMVHTGECRYRCGLETCGRSFSRKDLCVMHIKRSHQNVGDVFVLKVQGNERFKSTIETDEVNDAIGAINNDFKVEHRADTESAL